MRFIKMFYTIIISFSISSANSQKIIPLTINNNVDSVLRQTLFIMQELGFEIRKNLNKDAGRPLSTDIIRNMNDARERASLFRYDSIFWRNRDISTRIYCSPQICFRKVIYDIIFHNHDTLAAQNESMKWPGFKDFPEGFEIVPYTLDKREWPEGFAIIDYSKWSEE